MVLRGRTDTMEKRMTISRERDNRGIEPAWNEQEAYALLQPLLRQYATLLAQGSARTKWYCCMAL